MRSGIVLISHDRRLLERISRATVWLDRGITRVLDQGFAHFEGWRDQVLEQEEIERHKLGRKIVMEEDWLRYGVTARRKRNQKRLGDLHALRKKHKEQRGALGKVKLEAAEADLSGRLVMVADGISKAYGGRTVVRDFSTRIIRGDRVGIVGQNGAGKTTLLNMLTGKLSPRHRRSKARHQPGRGRTGPASRRPGPAANPVANPDRRRRRHSNGRRPEPPCRQLHEGFPVRARAGEHPCGRAVRGRTWSADTGPRLRHAVQPDGAGRTDQRSGSGNA